MKRSLHDCYTLLYNTYGPQHWWPGDTPTEIAIGAILTQNTAWTNVEKAIVNLKQANMLCLQKIGACRRERLARLIRPAGYFNVKSSRLKHFAHAIATLPDGLTTLSTWDVTQAREFLLAINGIGPETADSILLYACNHRTFVVDTYTMRFLTRHGYQGSNKYQAVQDLFVDALPRRKALYNEFHALIVNLGKYHCKPKARCEKCPLKGVEL